MRKIFFATTNEGKLKEAKEILGIDVEGAPLEVEEIQSLDPVKVAVQKAKECYKKLKKPIFVEDISLFIKTLGQLPGTYIDAFMKSLGNEGIVSLLQGRKDRSVVVQATVVFIDEGGKDHVFVGSVKGEISQKPKGVGFGWDPIFIPEGEARTFGEMSLEEKNRYSMRAKALAKFKKWLDSQES